MINIRKLIFISSKQDELQNERDAIKDLINVKDNILPKRFEAKTFEIDLSGRREPVNQMTEEWVLKSDIYLGIFDREYSEPSKVEYEIAVKDVQVKKEIMIFIRRRLKDEREEGLNTFLSPLLDPKKGHSCIFYNSQNDLLLKVRKALLNYLRRKTEGFVLSKELLGPNLEGAKNTSLPEKLRRKLLQPFGRFAIWRGRKGVPEYYIYDWDGTKIDVTWDSIEPKASPEVKEFYKQRYRKPFDS